VLVALSGRTGVAFAFEGKSGRFLLAPVEGRFRSVTASAVSDLLTAH
jgi:hypothetical protein